MASGHGETKEGKRDSANRKEFNLDLVLGELRGRLDKLEDSERYIKDRINNFVSWEFIKEMGEALKKRIEKLETEKPTIDQIRHTYVFNKLEERINSLENDLMRHQDKDRDWAFEITSQANKWIKETNEQVKKLEALHKTDKPAERKVREKKGLPSEEIVRKYLKYRHGYYRRFSANSLADDEFLYFQCWLNENDYEIREKK